MPRHLMLIVSVCKSNFTEMQQYRFKADFNALQLKLWCDLLREAALVTHEQLIMKPLKEITITHSS